MADSYRDYFNDRITQEMDRQKEYGLNAKYDAVQKASDDKIAQLKEEIRTNKRNEDLFWKSRTGSTLFEDVKDVGLAGVQGVESLLKLPTMVIDKAASGNFYGPATQKLSEWQDDQEKMKSALSQYKTQEKGIVSAERGQAAKDLVGDGVAGTVAQVATEFGSSFWEAMKDPTSIPEFLAQQAAQLGVTGKVGRTVEAGAKVAAKAAPKLAATKLGEAALEKSATAGAVGFSAGLQGIDVGSDTMQRLMAMPDSIWLENPEYVTRAQAVGAEQAKQEMASDLASKATLAAAGASLLSTKMVPGGAALEKALVGKGKATVGMVPKVFASEGTQEGLEEGSGQFLSNVAVKEINPNQSLAEGVGNAAGQGAFMGGLLGGGVQALNTSIPDSIRNLAQAREEQAGKEQLMKGVVDTGDVTALVDPKSETYDPHLAVQGLQAHAAQADKTEEQKQTAFDQATQVVSQMETRLGAMKDSLGRLTKKGLESDLAEAQQALRDIDPANTQLVDEVQVWIQSVQDRLSKFDEKAAAETLASRQADIADFETKLEQSKATLVDFHKTAQSVDLDVDTEAKTITADNPEAAQASADKIIKLLMAIPERLSDATADSLSKNTGLTDAQRAYFRVFPKARAHANSLLTMGKTSQEVYFGKAADPANGKPRMLGIKDYRAEVGTALASGDRAKADKFLGYLKSFVQDHAQKSVLTSQAYDAVKAGGPERKLVRLANGGWEIQAGKFASSQARAENGGLDISRASAKLPGEIRTESAALRATLAELTAAYNVTFGGSNVKNVSPAEGVQAGSQSKAPAKTEASSKTGTASNEQGTTESDVQSSKSDESAQTAEETRVTEEAPASSAKTVKDVSTESTQSTAVETQSTQESTADSQSDASSTESTEGTLSALSQKAEAGVTYEKLKAGDLFTQNKGDESGSTRPLVAVKGFFTALAAGTTKVLDFVKGQDALTDTQVRLMSRLGDHVKAWAPKITANLKPSHNENFNHEDPLRYFITDGDLDENMKSAMVAAIYSFVADQAGRVRINGEEAINAILGVQADTPVDPKAWKMLAKVGVYRHVLADTLGGKVLDSLGLTGNRTTAGQDLEAKLRISLGGHMLALMEEVGLVEKTAYTNEEMSQISDAITGNSKNKGHVFYKVKEDAEGNLTGEAKDIYDSVRGTESLLNRLFGMEEAVKFAYLAPNTQVQEKTKTGMSIPKFLKELIFGQKAKEPWVVDQTRFSVLGQFSLEQAHEIFGVEQITSDNTHADDQLSKKAKNAGLIQEYALFTDFVGNEIATAAERLKTPFYLGFDVWVQQRVGVSTSAVNPQGSKIVRWLITAPVWDKSIPTSDGKLMRTFKLKVAEGFGIKPEKGDSSKAEAKLSAMMIEPRIAAGLKAMQKALTKADLTDAEKQHILNAVADGGQRAHTFAALVAWAGYQNAMNAGHKEFNTNLMGEVDGVSNGTILNHVLYGAAATAEALNQMLESGGIYALSSKFRQYNMWRGIPGNLDTYEAAADGTAQQLLKGEPAVVAALWATGGKLIDDAGAVIGEGRNLMKIGINPLNYGSGIKSIKNKVAGQYLETIREKLAKLSSGEASQQEVDAYITQLNVVLKAGGAPALKVGLGIKDYMGYDRPTFTAQQLEALQTVYGNVMGETMTDVIGEKFKPLLAATKQGVRTSNAMFNIYAALYEAERAKLLDTMPKNSKGQPIRDLTAAEEATIQKKLKDVLPSINTAMSAAENNPAAGVLMADRERKMSNLGVYSVEVGFANSPSMSMKGQRTETTAPGVAMVANTTQSADSRISHLSQVGRQVFNMHDALGDGVGGLADTALALNTNTWQSLFEYSPLIEAHQGLMRMMQGVVAMKNAGTLTSEAIDAIKERLATLVSRNEKSVEGWFLRSVGETFAEAIEAQRVKFRAMAQWAVIDQYTFDGGSYEVTDAQRAQAQQAAEALNSTMTAEDAETLQAFSDAIFGDAASMSPVPSAFGPLGEAKIKSDADLVKFFKANPKATAKQVIDLLGAKGRLNDVNRKLLVLVSRTVDLSLPVQFITPTTKEGDVLAKVEKARGWFVSTADAQGVYVLSPEFEHSGLTAETLLHELVHAAVATVIDSPSAEAAELVNELKALMAKAKEYAEANGITEFDAALNDVQEFVAWGISNQTFQDTVLRKITMESKTAGNRLVDGMKKFIATLAGLLKRDTDEINNGLKVLIGNVSGLFNEAGIANATKESGKTLTLAQANTADREWTTQEVFTALDTGAVSPSFGTHLGNLLTGMVDAVYGPFGAFRTAMQSSVAANPMDVLVKAMEMGKAPLAFDIQAAGFAASNQEAFVMEQVEATVATALDINDITTKPAYRELYKLYVEAKAKLTSADFVKVGLTAADHDFVFGVVLDSNGRSAYLSRFAALGLASEKFNQLLKFKTEEGRANLGNDKSIFDRLMRWFEQILAYFNHKATNTYAGQMGDAKLQALVDRLMDIEAKHRFKAQAGQNQFNKYSQVMEDMTKGLVDTTKQKVLDIVKSPIVTNSSLGVVKWAGAIAGVAASGRAGAVMTALRSLRDHAMDERDGILAGLLREAKGPSELLQAMILITKHSENLRQNAIGQTSDVLLKEFESGGKTLNKEEKGALTAVLLRSGAHNLLGQYSLPQIAQMAADTAVLEAEIAKVEASLATGLKDQHIGQAHGLGYWKATDLNPLAFLMKNSYVVARMLGTQYAGKITEAEAQQEQPKIAALATLYALKYSKVADRIAVAKVMSQENRRIDGNGVELMLKLHGEMEKESLERLFNGNQIQMTHGYTPEIYDPYVTIEIADELAGKDLEAQGFVKGDSVSSDKDVPDANGAFGVKRHIYIRKDGGLNRRVSGAMSLTSSKAKGTQIHNGYVNVNSFAGAANAALQNQVTTAKIAALGQTTNPHRDMSQTKQVNVAPVYDDNGNVVNWSYLMSGDTKDRILKRENRFEKVMGTLAGSIIDKHTSKELNEQAITALRDQHDVESVVTPWSYTEISPTAADGENRELWNLLPEQTRMDIRRIWGRDAIMVRKDSVDGVFGYRKLSAGDFLTKERDDLDGMERFARGLFHSLALSRGMSEEAADNWAKRVGVNVLKGERGWQEVYKEVKDIVVVKNLFTLVGNVYSNASLLWLLGVKDGWKQQFTALRGIMAYEADHKKLLALEAKLTAGYSGIKAQQVQNDIARLKDAMARNPVTKLVDAGLMPTIVEDVDLQEDPYSYKTELGERLEGLTSKVPEGVKQAARTVWMSHDTPLYKMLSRATQYSDFVARYAMYEHLTNSEGKTHDEAISKALNAFVHYDVPMQRNLQYLDDMGFTPFMKYFYRIQRVLFETAKERPGRMLTMVLMNRFMDLGPIVLDSTLVHHVGNMPFKGGALRLPAVMDELLTVQAGLALVK